MLRANYRWCFQEGADFGAGNKLASAGGEATRPGLRLLRKPPDEHNDSTAQQGLWQVTIRAVLLGLLGAAFFCGITYFNDAVMNQTMMIGSNMPIAAYGGLVIFVLLINPLLKRLALSGRELAVAFAITLAACCIPGSGLMRTFTPSLILPHHWARVEPGWQAEGAIEMAPARMLADVAGNEEVAVGGFVQGLGDGKGLPSLSTVPWEAWTGTLAFWIPLILTFWVGLIGLSVVTHRQWSDHEHLPYPLATFAGALLPEEGKRTSSVFRNRLFWIGLGAVLLIYLNNYACEWFPRQLVKVPTAFSLGALGQLFPTYVRGGGSLSFKFYFTVVGFAYLLASDVSFSLGIGRHLWALVVGVLLGYGISIRGGGDFGLRPEAFLTFGAYFGALLALIHTGRHYYGRVFREALFLPARQGVERASVWGARVFLAGAILFIANLVHIGLDWQLALLYTGLTFTLFLVMGRVIAETGLFFIQAHWYPCVIIWGLFGARAMGPRTLLFMMLLSMVLVIDPREALMPFMVNSLKLMQLRKVKVGKPAVFCAIAVIVGLAVAIPVTLAFQYDRGADMMDGWATRAAPTITFNAVVRAKQRLAGQGTLEHANSLSGWRRVAEMSPNGRCALAFGIGLALFLLFTMGRLRFRKWPIHPVMFLTWNQWAPKQFAASFLAGWFIKVIVTKYGGAGVYQKLKPLMFGLIAGEILGGIIPMIIGSTYYFLTGSPPNVFEILPG